MRRVQLGDVARIETGTTPSTKNPDYHGGDIPFVKPGDLDDQPKTISEAESYVTDLGAEKGRIIPKNGVMVCCIGSLGKLAIAGRDMITNQQINSVIFDEEKVDPKFGAYFLSTQKKELEHLASSTTVAIVNKTNFSKLEIPLPSLSEQKAIVAKLDRAQRLIDIDQEMLAKYDELIHSVFLEMFGDPVRNPKGWEVKSLKNACSKVTDGTHDTPERIDSGVPLITGKNIRSFKIDFGTTDFVSQEDHEKIYKRCNPEFGDVLYVNIGAGIGTAAFNNIHEEFSMKNVALLKPKNGVLSGRYLESCLNNEVMKEKIKYIASLGGAQKFLGLGDIRKLKIPVPDIGLQIKFGSYYAKIENEKTKTLESLKKSEELFSSLVQGAFG